MPSLFDFATSEQICSEYKKSFLLNIFRKICRKMKNDEKYNSEIKQLFRESCNINDTSKAIVRRYNYELEEDEAILMSNWLLANLYKTNNRKTPSDQLKKELYKKQNGLCAVCNEELGNAWNNIHVDHIVPFSLVGDELENNYQLLCTFCNESKSAHTDYIFKSLIKLN